MKKDALMQENLDNSLQNARLLLVDDHTVLLESLRDMFMAHGFGNIQTATSSDQVREMLRETPADLIITDISMPDGSGLQLAKQVKRYAPQTKLMFLTMLADDATIGKAADIGAEGFISKAASTQSLLRAAKSILDGASVYPAGQNTTYRHRKPPPEPPTLTEREEEVLTCVGEGFSNKEIARELDMAEGTVKVHIKTILKKLGVNNRTQAAIYAYEHGFTQDLADIV